MRNSASVFTAELTAIHSCLSHLTQRPPQQNYIILTDSLSSLLSLQDPYSNNPLSQRILISLQTLSSIQSAVTFIWIPSHIGLPHHDEVDRAAKESTLSHTITDPSPSPAYDLKTCYRSLITTAWNNLWTNLPHNKLRHIKSKPSLWSTSNRNSRREEVILSRLRIGHTRLTHSYLLLNLHPPSCNYCQSENLTVQHLFLCPALHNLRTLHSVPQSISSALCNNSEKVSGSINYLRSTYFYPLL